MSLVDQAFDLEADTFKQRREGHRRDHAGERTRRRGWRSFRGEWRLTNAGALGLVETAAYSHERYRSKRVIYLEEKWA